MYPAERIIGRQRGGSTGTAQRSKIPDQDSLFPLSALSPPLPSFCVSYPLSLPPLSRQAFRLHTPLPPSAPPPSSLLMTTSVLRFSFLRLLLSPPIPAFTFRTCALRLGSDGLIAVVQQGGQVALLLFPLQMFRMAVGCSLSLLFFLSSHPALCRLLLA
eukprot:Sspe_Gene.45191::Locus_22332_Transcript_1_1_Confidence_1.000_Length_2268::g.45191::m.45191